MLRPVRKQQIRVYPVYRYKVRESSSCSSHKGLAKAFVASMRKPSGEVKATSTWAILQYSEISPRGKPNVEHTPRSCSWAYWDMSLSDNLIYAYTCGSRPRGPKGQVLPLTSIFSGVVLRLPSLLRNHLTSLVRDSVHCLIIQLFDQGRKWILKITM